MFIPSVIESFNPNVIDSKVGERHVTVEKAIAHAKDRAKSLELERDRRSIYEPDHFHLWKGQKSTKLIEKPEAPEYVANFFNQQSVIDGQLGKLQSEIVSGLIQQFNKVVYITNPKNYDITQLFESEEVLYVPGVKPIQQLAVDQYAKTMIQTVLQVVRKSSATQEIQFQNAKLQRLEFFIQKLIDSGNENLKPMLNKILNSENYAHEMNFKEYRSGPVTCKDLKLTYDEIYKENHQLHEKNKELQHTLDHKINFANKQRMDSLKEIQVLRDRIIMMGYEINEETLKKNTVALNIQYFNPFEGFDKEIVDLINERMKDIKHEAEIQITAKKMLADMYLHKINLYKKLQPEDYSVVDMTLGQIFKNIAVLEPQSYPVWNALLKAFPKGHFASLIFEYANQDKDDEESGTYNRLMEIVENGLLHVRTKQMETIEQIKERITFVERQLADARNDQITMRTHHAAEIEKINLIHKEKFTQYVEQERLNFKLTLDKEKAELIRKNQRKKEKIRRLRQINQTYEVRRMIQKWKLSTTILRYVEQLQTGFLDKESFKLFILQDIKRIFHGPEILKMQNEIKLNKQLKNEHQKEKIDLIDENYQLRATINVLLTEREVNQQRLDSLGFQLDDQLSITDKHQQSQQDVLEDKDLCEYKLKHVLDQFQKALTKVDYLEEKYGIKPSAKVKKISIKKVKLIQAQKVVEMFQHEMECLELRLFGKMQLEKKAILCGKRNEKMNQGSQTQIKDVNFGLQQVFSKPIKFQVMILKQDQDIQTDINSNIYDYMVKATATYDRILQSGQPIKPQENFEEDDEDQIQKLIDLENTDAIMFSRRKIFASKALTQGIAEVDRTMANRTLSPIIRSKTYAPGSTQFGIARTGQGDLITSDSDGNERSKRRKIELKSTKISPDAISPEAQVNDTRETPLSINPVQLGSKLDSTNKKDRSFNSSPNSMPFVADISSPTNDVQVLAQINQITQLNPQQLQQIFFNHDWNLQMQKEKSIRDLKAQADQKTAIDCFEMYVELLQVIKDLEPESFKNAIMIIKEKKFPQFELKPLSHIKQLYPDFVPDVYTRLWETRLEPKESLERKKNYDNERLQWSNKLQDQKLLDIKSKRQPILTKNNQIQLNTIIRNRSSSPLMQKLLRNKSNVSSQRSQPERMSPIGIDNQAKMNFDIDKALEEDVENKKGIFQGQSEVQILLQSVETLPNYNDSKPTSPAKMSDVIDQSNQKSNQRLQNAKVQNTAQNLNQSSNERNLIEVHKNAKSQIETVFPTGQLHVKSFIPKVQSGSFKVQDISASTIRMRSLGQIKQVEKNLPTRNTTEVQSVSDFAYQGRQNSDGRIKPSNKSFAVSVSQLKPYYPQDQEKKVKPMRPVTSKGRSTTFMPLFDSQQREQSETGLANVKMVSGEQSHRPLTGTTTNITCLGKELASRVSVTAGGGFNPMMFTRNGNDSKHPSDSSMTSFQPRKFQSNQQTIRIKEFDGGFENKTLKAKHHRFKKKQSETPLEYVNRLKFGIKVEQVVQTRNTIKRARPETANTRLNQEILSIPITLVPTGRKDHQPYTDLNSNLLTHQNPQSSFKIENFVSTNFNQHLQENLQSNEMLEKTQILMKIGNKTEKRSAPLFTNQMLTQQQRNQHSIGHNQAFNM